MSFDIAIDYTTGDMLMAVNNDILGRTGPDVYKQRIRIRLKIERGKWALDPTGELGSRLLELARVPVTRALQEIQQYVQEALAPMDDITVQAVEAQLDPNDSRSIVLNISFIPHDESFAADTDPAAQTISFSIPAA